MRRRVHRSDDNQADIVAALRKVGCAVFNLRQPVDLLVYVPPGKRVHGEVSRGETLLVEVKNPDGYNRFTAAQKDFRAKWKGPWYVVRSVDEALELVGARVAA